jgi:hypothetical protein
MNVKIASPLRSSDFIVSVTSNLHNSSEFPVYCRKLLTFLIKIQSKCLPPQYNFEMRKRFGVHCCCVRSCLRSEPCGESLFDFVSLIDTVEYCTVRAGDQYWLFSGFTIFSFLMHQVCLFPGRRARLSEVGPGLGPFLWLRLIDGCVSGGTVQPACTSHWLCEVMYCHKITITTTTTATTTTTTTGTPPPPPHITITTTTTTTTIPPSHPIAPSPPPPPTSARAPCPPPPRHPPAPPPPRLKGKATSETSVCISYEQHHENSLF